MASFLLKCTDRAFPASAIKAAGYGAVWRGEGRWNGAAILASGVEPVLTRRALPGDPADTQARYIEAAVSGVLIGCLYLPNGNPQPGPKFDYKLAWFERLIAHAADLQASGAPVILAGDYSVVPTDADIYNTRSWSRNALLQPGPRRAYARLLAAGWTDALRAVHGDAAPYTFWPYLRDGWRRDAGWRIDHLLLSPDLADRLSDAGVDREVRGESNASDHAPAWIELRARWTPLLGGRDKRRIRLFLDAFQCPTNQIGAADNGERPAKAKSPDQVQFLVLQSHGTRAGHAIDTICTASGTPAEGAQRS